MRGRGRYLFTYGRGGAPPTTAHRRSEEGAPQDGRQAVSHAVRMLRLCTPGHSGHPQIPVCMLSKIQTIFRCRLFAFHLLSWPYKNYYFVLFAHGQSHVVQVASRLNVLLYFTMCNRCRVLRCIWYTSITLTILSWRVREIRPGNGKPPCVVSGQGPK